MPGARLTLEDRRRIAAWMTDGLGYAEIARRLGRPTSTISREVARNGEPGTYRPDPAQKTSARRARRRIERPAEDSYPDERVRDFVDQFAAVLVATGFPRMASRVFVGLLTRDSGSLTAAELVRLLRVSPASVSKAIGYLERMDLIVRASDPGERRERYAIVDDVWLRAWRTDTGAHARVAAAARRGTEIFGAGTPAGARLGEMGRFFGWLSGQMGAGTAVISVTLGVPDLVAAAQWYARAMGAIDLGGGLAIGGAPFSVAQPGTSAARLEILVDDPDALIGRAVAAGADIEPGGVRDPYGHVWLIRSRP